MTSGAQWDGFGKAGGGPADLGALKMRVEALEHEVKDLSGPNAPRLPEPIPLRP